MSNDLISRSAVIKEINEYMKNVYECDIESVSDFQRGNESKESYIVQGLFEAFELIGNVPVAYDVDKVFNQIKKYAYSDICNHHRGCPYTNDVSICCENCGAIGALKIIKYSGMQ